MAGLGEAGGQLQLGDLQGDLAGARVAETACPQGDLLIAGGLFDHADIHRLVILVVKVDRHRAAAPRIGQWSVDARQRHPAAVSQGRQVVQQPAGQTVHAFVDQVVADGFQVFQTDLDGRDVEIIQGAILKAGRGFGQVIFIPLHRGHGDRPAGKPGTVELAQHRLAGDQRPQPGGVTEHLVERERDEIRLNHREVEAAGGDEGGCIQQHVPTLGVGLFDPIQGMLDRGEIRLGRVGEQIPIACARGR